jgi:hypothetical protein
MDLLHKLVDRIIAARGKGHLQQLLRQTKEQKDLKRSAFRVTGSKDEIQKAVFAAVADGHLDTADVARLVDEIEECGSQHVYLYDLTDAGVAALTDQTLREFRAAPQQPTDAFYADRPDARRTYSVERGGRVFVKQVYTATFWEIDENDPVAENSDRRRVRVEVVRERRGVNVFRVDRTARTAEIRIDRIRSREDRTLAEKELQTFLTSLSRVVDSNEHLRPIEIRRAFPRIVDADDETFIATDMAADADVRQLFSSRREGRRGQDVRKHPNYKLRGSGYVRDSLNVYWDFTRSPDEEPESIHTIIRAVDREADEEDDSGTKSPTHDDDDDTITTSSPANTVEHAKVYIPAHISESALTYVLGRIRHFARSTS